MKAILFDLDGTLIDSSEGITKSAQYALSTYGIEVTDLDSLKCFIGPPLAGSFKKYYNFDDAKSKEAVIRYRVRYVKDGIFECSLYPGVKKALEDLKAKGYIIAVASSKPETSCRRILEFHKIDYLFDEIVGATDDGRIETKEEVLKELFRRLRNVSVSEMCLIGDTIFDIEGANKVGMSSIGVSFGFGDTDDMLAAGAINICDSMEEVVTTIYELDRR